jgi:sugar O-acyltransferase (sialic acid O-acetyltransferase NeuD family)
MTQKMMPGKSQLVIIGAGGHALSVADAALSSGWASISFYSQDGAGPAESVGPVLSTLESLDLATTACALGIGTNHEREDAWEEVRTDFPTAQLTSVIHPTAWVSPHSTVHNGAVILAHASVGPGSIIERGALLNTGASLDHDSSLGSFSSLGPGARTGGNVRIGERSMIGMQAGILHGISVGSDTVIGAHSLVNQDVENNTVAWGSPARGIRSRAREDAYY